jgi:uridine kinase
MKGDIVVLQEHHRRAASRIVPMILGSIIKKNTVYTITVAGESGSGKSETSLAIANELEKHGIKVIILGQDDYFILPPKLNGIKRQKDPDWLGPHIEVRLDLLEQNLKDAIKGKTEIIKPLVDYDANTIEMQTINLDGAKVVIAEGTYVSLLKHVDSKIFITRNWQSTLEDRKKRNRGNEVGDPFTEQILATEHKIIAGHRQLADFIINDEYKVINVELEK